MRGAIGTEAGVAGLPAAVDGKGDCGAGIGRGAGVMEGKPGNGTGNPEFIWGMGARIARVHFGHGPSTPANCPETVSKMPQ